MLFCSVPFSIVAVPVKRFILHVNNSIVMSLPKPCAAPCWSLTAARWASFSFVPWIPGAELNSTFLYRRTVMSPTGCPIQVQPTESSPFGCSLLGSACSWWLSLVALSAQQAARAYLLPVLPEIVSLTNFLPFLSPCGSSEGMQLFLYICSLICLGCELLPAHILRLGYLGWE